MTKEQIEKGSQILEKIKVGQEFKAKIMKSLNNGCQVPVFGPTFLKLYGEELIEFINEKVSEYNDDLKLL